MRLSDFLRADFVVAALQGRDVESVIHEVAHCAGKALVGQEELIAERLLERERDHPTVMGSGLAIPHATVPGLPEPVIGVALSADPVQFGPVGLEPARVFFILLSPPGREREHVKLLARICRLARHDDFIERLEAAENEVAIIRVIEEIDAQHV